MALGTYGNELAKQVNAPWQEVMMDLFAQGTLTVRTPQITADPDDPLATTHTTFATRIFYGISGNLAQSHIERAGGSVDSQRQQFILTNDNMDGLTYTAFEALLRTPDVNLDLNGTEVTLAQITEDVLGKGAKLSLLKVESDA